MDNAWDFSADGLTYTEGIPIGEPYTHPHEEIASETGEGFVAAPAPPGGQAGRRKQVSKRVPRREKNYTVKEDEMLCGAYLNVSKDPIVGCNQSTGGYWARIFEYFHEHKEVPSERSQSSLQHRWGSIQKDTQRFCAFYDAIQRRNESGKNDDDKLKDALEMFQGVVGVSFAYTHCWCILRHERKWNDWLASTNQKDKPSKGPVDQSSNAAEEQASFRPIGRDRAKKQRKSSSSSSSSACLEVLQKMSIDRTAYEERQEEHSKEILSRADRKLAAQERLAAAQERLAATQEFEQEQRIMSIDVEKVVHWQRNYYLNLQRDIIKKRNAGAGSSGIP